ncbi:hypothetical protein FIBSPDRAFT_605216 [Athelia psychrophila]|uniref:F-box domain-containing protein n=1 Tax=Athelia psychrophila TaxID=1759441 RepID=A0A166GLD7_9AGAM|nr:hypothetical protein FIBSPDRAFT_605216 [Fibularhizoctonia sp. CBS 109695]
MTIHRALAIVDIVVSISAQLEEENEKATLASCAQCCRFFSTLALDSLWRRLDVTLPLDRLFPQDLEEFSTSKELLEVWARFDFYANRVHYVADENNLSDLFYQLSALRTGVAPLPSLRHLSLVDVPPLRLHFPPHIRSLAIAVPQRLSGKSAEAILTRFATQVPLLKKLKLSGPVPVTILPIITTFQHLHCVDLDRIDLPRPLDQNAFDAFITALSRMPAIAELDLPRVRGGEPVVPACGGFPCLELLSSWDPPQTLSKFIAALDTRNLHHIHIASRLSSTSELHDCLRVISSTHGQSIRTVEMARGHDLEDLPWMNTIQPLLDISNMVNVAFPLTMQSNISVADVRAMANAWPRLTKIGGIRLGDSESAYQAIISFYRLCPTLLFLDIYVDGECIGPFPESQALLPHPLRILNADFSHTPEDRRCRCGLWEWLGQMFPRLTLTTSLAFRDKWVHTPIDTAVQDAQATRFEPTPV